MKGKTALITGSTAGFGVAVATALAAEGCNIVMTGLGDPADIERQRRGIEEAAGAKVRFIAADLRKVDEIENLVAESCREFGAVDILINNAVSRHTGAVEVFAPAHWDQDIAVNLSAAFHLIRLTMAGMKRANWGRIVNMSSTMGMFGVPNRVSYVTTKTALIGLTRAIAAEVGGTGVTCNALCPSAMLSDNADRLIKDIEAAQGLSREDAVEVFLKQRNRQRFVDTVPAMIVFLCSENGRDMNGTAIPMDLGAAAGQPASAAAARA
jgi:3-hydroxybutyrate dehydrogenase